MNEQERKAFEYYWSAENSLGRIQDINIRQLEYENLKLTRSVEKLKNELQALKRENRLLKGLPEEEPVAETILDPVADGSLNEERLPVRCIAGFWSRLEQAEEEEIADGNRPVDYWRRMGNPEEGYNGRMMNLYEEPIDEEPIEEGVFLSDEEIDDEPKRDQTIRFANHKPEFESKRFYSLDYWSMEPADLAFSRKREEFYDVEEEFHDVIEESVPFPANPNANGDAFGLRSTRETPFPHFEFKNIVPVPGDPVVRENEFEKAIKNCGNIDDDNSDDDYDDYSVQEFDYNSSEENLEEYWKRW